MREPESLTTGLVAQGVFVDFSGDVKLGDMFVWLVVREVRPMEVCILMCWDMFF